MNNRFFVGVICLLVLVAFFIDFPIDSGNVKTGTSTSLNTWEIVGMLLAAVWIVASIAVKITMIADKKIRAFNAISTNAWVLLFFTAILSPSTSSDPTPQSAIQFILGALFIFGWPIVDAIDLYCMKKQ